MKTLTRLDTPILGEPFINDYNGKTYIAVKGKDNTCTGCVLYRKDECKYSPDCIIEIVILKEYNN